MIDGGQIVDEGKPAHRSIFGEATDGGLWQAVIKAADRGRHFLLSTFHAAKPRDLARALRRQTEVEGE